MRIERYVVLLFSHDAIPWLVVAEHHCAINSLEEFMGQLMRVACDSPAKGSNQTTFKVLRRPDLDPPLTTEEVVAKVRAEFFPEMAKTLVQRGCDIFGRDLMLAAAEKP